MIGDDLVEAISDVLKVWYPLFFEHAAFFKSNKWIYSYLLQMLF